MARSIAEIKKVIIDQIATVPALAALSSNTSSVALYNLFAYVVAFCVWTSEVLFDKHKADVDAALLLQKPHTLPWYQAKALAFQYGHFLVFETDRYNNTGFTEDAIKASKIVKYAAVNEAANESRLIIKIAGESSGVLAPITSLQYDAITSYFSRIKDAGVFITLINYLPDRLYLNMRIFYDPLILDDAGNNIILGGKPVEAALTAFMKELPFDGGLVLANLIDRLQKVPGVVIPHLDSARSSFIDPATDDYGIPEYFYVKKRPASGYFELPNFDGITYLPYAPETDV